MATDVVENTGIVEQPKAETEVSSETASIDVSASNGTASDTKETTPEVKETYTKAEYEAERKKLERHFQSSKDKEVLEWKVKHSELEKRLKDIETQRQNEKQLAEMEVQENQLRQKWVNDGVDEGTINSVLQERRLIAQEKQKYGSFDKYMTEKETAFSEAIKPQLETAKRNMAFEFYLKNYVEDGESLLKEAEGVIKPWLEARDRKEMELLVMKSLYDKTKEERDIAKRPVTRSDSGIASGKTSDGIPTNKQAFENWVAGLSTKEYQEKRPKILEAMKAGRIK